MCVASAQEARCSHTWNRKRGAWGELVSGSRLVSARFLHSRGGVTPISPLCTQGSGGALSPLRKQLRTQRDFVKFDASSSPKPLFFRKAKGSGAATLPGPGLQVPNPRPAARCPSAPRPTTATRGADGGSARWPQAPLLASAASRGVPALFRQPFRPRAARGLSGELEVWSVTPFRVGGTGVPCPRSLRTRQRRRGRKLWGVWVHRSAWDTRGVVRASRGGGRGWSLFQGSGRQGQPCRVPRPGRWGCVQSTSRRQRSWRSPCGGRAELACCGHPRRAHIK